MPLVTVNLIGRFGNQAMQYLYARAYADRHGFDFECDPWIGQEIFMLDDVPISRKLPGRTELTVKDGEGDICFRDFYAQSQAAMIYTKATAQRWLTFKPSLLYCFTPKSLTVAAHRRVGDYAQLGYPVVSLRSYEKALTDHKIAFNWSSLFIATEEDPLPQEKLPLRLSFLPDFYALRFAEILLRSNSTFSWLAGLLSNGRVLSPVIDGFGAGEHDAEFVEGNWPRFCSLPFVTDLHLPV